MLFFFQAEDGIRDGRVTGVQTCALPISAREHLGQQAPLGRLHDAAPADPVGGERVARDAARSTTVTREPRRPSSIAVTTPARRAPTTTTSLSYPLSLMAGTMPAARP